MKFAKIIPIALAAVMAANIAVVSVSADWETKGKYTYYADDNGEYVTGLQKIDGKTYYFSSSGKMKTGWLTMKSGKTFYFKKDGSMVTGWAKINSERYYFGKNGVMRTGYQIIGKSAYFFTDDGVMTEQIKDELFFIDNKAYYSNSNGKLATGLKVINTPIGELTYYFDKTGASISGEKTIDGVVYTFDSIKGMTNMDIPVKTSQCFSTDVNITRFKVKNGITATDKNNVNYSGMITNTYAKSNAISVTVYADFYGKEGNILKANQTIFYSSKMNRGDTITFSDYIEMKQPVYEVKITKISVYKVS